MVLMTLTKDLWRSFAIHANLLVFSEDMNPLDEKIDFAMLSIDEEVDKPVGFATFQERDSKSVHIQYAGLFKEFRGKGIAEESMKLVLSKLKEKYERVSMLVENTNKEMIKLSLKLDLVCFGIRNYKGKVFLEIGKEF